MSYYYRDTYTAELCHFIEGVLPEQPALKVIFLVFKNNSTDLVVFILVELQHE